MNFYTHTHTHTRARARTVSFVPKMFLTNAYIYVKYIFFCSFKMCVYACACAHILKEQKKKYFYVRICQEQISLTQMALIVLSNVVELYASLFLSCIQSWRLQFCVLNEWKPKLKISKLKIMLN